MNIGELFVRLSADTRGLKSGVRDAQTTLRTLTSTAAEATAAMLPLGLGVGGVLVGLSRAFEAADQFDASMGRLSAAAKLSGQNLGFLQTASEGIQGSMGLGATGANELTIAVAKLASKAGDVSKTAEAMRAFLDLGAAQGLGLEQTLTAVNQALLGIDEGTDKLFGKNPSVLYQEFAASIGTTAGKLTDAQKAQAILTAAFNDGGKVAGQYAKWLQSPAGQSELLRQANEKLAVSIGKSMSGIRSAALPVLAQLADGLRKFIGGMQLLDVDFQLSAARMGVHLGVIRDAFHDTFSSSRSNFAEDARKRLNALEAAAVQARARIVNTMEGITPITGPTNARPTVTPPAGIDAGAAEKAASRMEKALNDAFDRVRTRLGDAMEQIGHRLADPMEEILSGRGGLGRAGLAGVVGANPAFKSQALPAIAAPTRLDSLRAGLAQFTGGLKEQIGGLLTSFGPLALAAAALAPVFEGLRPAFEVLKEPLRIIGQLLGAQITPLLQLLAIPLRMLAKVSSYVTEALGLFILGIGKLIDKIPGISGGPIIRAGQEMIDGARNARKALDGTAEAANKLNASISNMPPIFDLALRRRQAMLGGAPAPIPAPRPPAPAPGEDPADPRNPPERGGLTIHINNPGPGVDARALERQLKDLLVRNPEVRFLIAQAAA